MGQTTAFNLTYNYLKQNMKNENVFAAKHMFPEKSQLWKFRKYKECVCDRHDLRGPGVRGGPAVLLNMNWIFDMFLFIFQNSLHFCGIKIANISPAFKKIFSKG